MGIFSKKKSEKTNERPDFLDPEYIKKRDGETNQEYNERVPVAVQPVQPSPTKSYLGEDL